MLFPHVSLLMWISAKIIRTCRTPELQTHAAGPPLQMNTAPWYNSHQSSINFPFLCLQQGIKRVIHQSSLSLVSPLPPCSSSFILRRETLGRGGVESLESWKGSCRSYDPDLALWLAVMTSPRACLHPHRVTGIACQLRWERSRPSGQGGC